MKSQDFEKYVPTLVILAVLIYALHICTPYVSMVIAWFGPSVTPRIQIIEQLLNNASNYYNILCTTTQVSSELAAAYDSELQGLLKTLSLDRYLVGEYTDIEKAGFNEFIKYNDLINEKIRPKVLPQTPREGLVSYFFSSLFAFIHKVTYVEPVYVTTVVSR